MNKRIKKLWIKALRGGEYKQARGCLRTKSGHCCLGVLTDIYRKIEHKGRWRRDDEWMAFIVDDETAEVTLPNTVVEWAGLRDIDPKLGGTRAARLNDSGKSFDYIADKIDKYL